MNTLQAKVLWLKESLQVICKKRQALHSTSHSQVHTIIVKEIKIEKEHIMCEEENNYVKIHVQSKNVKKSAFNLWKKDNPKHSTIFITW
jgi:hypothetical protein